MDSFRTLIEKKQFQLVADLTKACRDAQTATFRIAALVGLGRLEEALDLIAKFRGDFGDDTFTIMKVHLELLLMKNKYDKAYQELNYYKDLPYISQEVEEYLSQAEDMIRTHERNYNKNRKRSKEEIFDILEKGKDNLFLLGALNDIRDYNIGDFTNHLILLIKRSGINSFVSTYALFLLVSSGYQKPISILKNGKKYVVIPKDLEPPYINEKYDEVLKKIEAVAKDPTVSEVAISLLNELIIILYPDNIFDFDSDLLAGAILAIAYDHFQISRDDSNLAKLFAIDVDRLRQSIEDFSRLLATNPPIS